MARGLQTVEKERLLLVEGNDEDNFLSSFLTLIHPGARPIQIMSFDGKDNLSKFLPLVVKQAEFSMVQKIGIVRDNDEDPDAAFTSVCATLGNCGLSIPKSPEEFTQAIPAVNVFMMPGKSLKGALETLCLQANSGEPQMECVNAFAECIQQRKLAGSINLDKLRMQSYLGALGVRLIGEAARASKLNLTRNEYSAVAAFLQALLS